MLLPGITTLRPSSLGCNYVNVVAAIGPIADAQAKLAKDAAEGGLTSVHDCDLSHWQFIEG